MGLEDKLDEYSYLWDGSENWILQHISETKYSIFVHFEEGFTPQELSALRKIFSYFQNRKLHEIKAEVANLTSWASGGYNYATVHKVYQDAIKHGLSAEIVGQDLSKYQIINSDTNEILEMENSELFSIVIEKMLAAGVHVDYIEVD